MKQQFILIHLAVLLASLNGYSQNANNGNNSLYIDVHYLPAGKVSYADVAAAHSKDLAVEGKYGVQFLRYWVDESKGVVYCLSSAPDTSAISNTHREAHGLMPQVIYKVGSGKEATADKNKTFFLDIHQLGAGKVTAADVEGAHQKDLAVQKKYGVNFINYWVDESTGTIFCLSQASDASSVIQTHKEAHGLVPASITTVKQGQ
jgi:Nickel responsive protein SCO4226-like